MHRPRPPPPLRAAPVFCLAVLSVWVINGRVNDWQVKWIQQETAQSKLNCVVLPLPEQQQLWRSDATGNAAHAAIT
jgi:hypothetical protein